MVGFALGLLLVLPRWGLLGVALGAVAGSVVINLITLPLLSGRSLWTSRVAVAR